MFILRMIGNIHIDNFKKQKKKKKKKKKNPIYIYYLLY